MFAAIRRWEEGGDIRAVESSLLGSLILCPYLRLGRRVSALKAEHFSAGEHGAIFDAVMRLKHPEAVLVAHQIDASGLRPPQGSYGWATVVNSVLDDPLVDEEAAEAAAEAIHADFARRMAALRRAYR